MFSFDFVYEFQTIYIMFVCECIAMHIFSCFSRKEITICNKIITEFINGDKHDLSPPVIRSFRVFD